MTLYFSSSNIFNMTPNPVTPIYTDKNNLYSGHNHLLMTKTLSFINDKFAATLGNVLKKEH